MPIGSETEIGFTSSPQAWAEASRPCSIDVAARLGKPMTSPTA